VPKASNYLIPSARDLAMLTTEVATEALRVIDEASIRRHSYAMRGMLFGFLGLVVSTLVFGFLVYTGHSKEAYAVLGTNVAGLLLQMIRARI